MADAVDTYADALRRATRTVRHCTVSVVLQDVFTEETLEPIVAEIDEFEAETERVDSASWTGSGL